MQKIEEAIRIVKVLQDIKEIENETHFHCRGNRLYVMYKENKHRKLYRLLHRDGEVTIGFDDSSIVVQGSKQDIELIFNLF